MWLGCSSMRHDIQCQTTRVGSEGQEDDVQLKVENKHEDGKGGYIELSDNKTNKMALLSLCLIQIRVL